MTPHPAVEMDIAEEVRPPVREKAQPRTGGMGGIVLVKGILLAGGTVFATAGSRVTVGSLSNAGPITTAASQSITLTDVLGYRAFPVARPNLISNEPTVEFDYQNPWTPQGTVTFMAQKMAWPEAELEY